MTIELGNKPSERDPNAKSAHARMREAPAGEAGAAFRWSTAMFPSLFSGALTGSSLYHAQPMALSQWREIHYRSANHFQAGLLRWPRSAWGAFHLLIAGALYLVVWVTGSLPRALVVTAVVGLGFWLHVL